IRPPDRNAARGRRLRGTRHPEIRRRLCCEIRRKTAAGRPRPPDRPLGAEAVRLRRPAALLPHCRHATAPLPDQSLKVRASWRPSFADLRSGDRMAVDKITWDRVGRVTEPGRYIYTFGWLTITAGDLDIWK